MGPVPHSNQSAETLKRSQISVSQPLGKDRRLRAEDTLWWVIPRALASSVSLAALTAVDRRRMRDSKCMSGAVLRMAS